ncbi:MAG: DUF4783 domain-containing protein [Bacteroidales bacterium]|nr:DUF4783 domain-containing protein [Bacteroidales bacterium]
MKKLLPLVILTLLAAPLSLRAQNDGYDIFKPISSYLGSGDVKHLGVWFDDTLELTLLTRSINSSKNQAEKSLTSFFNTYPPTSFKVVYKVSKSNMKYCTGILKAGRDTFDVTIFLVLKGDSFWIQQLKFERSTAPY